MAEEDQVTLPEIFRARVEMPDGSHADCFGEGGAPPSPEDTAALSTAFAPLLADAYTRLLRVEADKATRASNKGNLAQHVAAFYADQQALHVAAAVRPVLGALLLAAGQSADADALAQTLAADHAAQSRADLAGGLDCLARWETRPAEQARRHLNLIWESLK